VQGDSFGSEANRGCHNHIFFGILTGSRQGSMRKQEGVKKLSPRIQPKGRVDWRNLERHPWKLKQCAVTPLKHVSSLPWQAILNLNERIPKFRSSARPFGKKLKIPIF
jgi:hypothetical protein